jgi:hypothetical protein
LIFVPLLDIIYVLKERGTYMLVTAGNRYSEFLTVYELKIGKNPIFVECTEAYFASKNNTIPSWMYW